MLDTPAWCVIAVHGCSRRDRGCRGAGHYACGLDDCRCEREESDSESRFEVSQEGAPAVGSCHGPSQVLAVNGSRTFHSRTSDTQRVCLKVIIRFYDASGSRSNPHLDNTLLFQSNLRRNFIVAITVCSTRTRYVTLKLTSSSEEPSIWNSVSYRVHRHVSDLVNLQGFSNSLLLWVYSMRHSSFRSEGSEGTCDHNDFDHSSLQCPRQHFSHFFESRYQQIPLEISTWRTRGEAACVTCVASCMDLPNELESWLFLT